MAVDLDAADLVLLRRQEAFGEKEVQSVALMEGESVRCVEEVVRFSMDLAARSQ